MLAAVRDQIAHAKINAPYFADHFADVDPRTITDRAALGGVPVTRKSDLIEQQKNETCHLADSLRCRCTKLGRIFPIAGSDLRS